MVDCIVQFEYAAEQSDELSMKVGDVIKNVIKHDGGWWEGELNGKKGMFPDNFVQAVAKKEEPKKVEDRKQSNVAQLQNKLGNTLEHMGAPMPVKHTKKSSSSKKHVKVTFSYAPSNDDELKLEVGDVIEVTKQEDEGWWEGILNGKSGVFPSNFVELIKEDEEHEPTPNNDKPPAEPEDKEAGPEIPGKKIKGIGLGNIFSGGPIKLRPAGSGSVRQTTQSQKAMEAHENKSKRSSTLPANSVPPERPPTLPPREQAVKPVERAKALYSYEAENDDEMSLEEGDIIVVLEKELEDSGWWKGEMKGKVGVFPDNFVELLPEEKPKKPPPPVASSRPLSNEIKANLPEPVRPEKSPALAEATKHHKHIHHKKQEEERPPPALPKKPGPPLHEKPRKSTPKLTETTVEEVKSEPEKTIKDTRTNSFDNVDSQERLSHPTAYRAKLPNRRPPSMRKETPTENEEVQPSPVSPKSPRPHSVSGSHVTTTKKDTSISPAETNHATSHATTDKATTSALQELRRDLADLKRNTVSKSDYNKLKEDFDQLKHDFATHKSQSNRRMGELMTEIDDEKKKRNGIEIDVERIRKLAMSS